MATALQPYCASDEFDNWKVIGLSLLVHGLLAVFFLVCLHPQKLPASLAPTITLVSLPAEVSESSPTVAQSAPSSSTASTTHSEAIKEVSKPISEALVPTQELKEDTLISQESTAADQGAGVPVQKNSGSSIASSSRGAGGGGSETSPVRVAGAATLDNVNFAPISELKPLYPAIARAANIEGYVDADLVISESGLVESFTITKTFGHASFAQETAMVLPKWRFPPPRINGKKQRIRYIYRVTFTLN